MAQITALADLASQVDAVVGGVLSRGVRGLADEELVSATVAAGAILRRIEGLLMEAADIIDDRSRTTDDERLDIRYGCANPTELVERLTAVGPGTAKRWITAGRSIAPRISLQGADLPPALPSMREEVLAGTVGLEGLLAAAAPLLAVRDRVPADDLWRAESAVADAVRSDPSAAIFDLCGRDVLLPTSANLLKVHAMAQAFAIDQDGAEPTEVRAMRHRSLTVGRLQDGLVPLRAQLMPEVAAQLNTIIDAITNPHGQPAGVRFRESDDEKLLDDRTPAQRRHDALATALTVAAGSQNLPTLGGAAPTLVVSVQAETLAAGRGWAEAGGMLVPLETAAHAGCCGTIQRVTFGGNGRIGSLSTESRIFTAHQRRALAARDGGCVIPGCSVPAAWTEAHHVTEWSQGGRTHIDNGVLLCWHHHRFIDRNGWKIAIRQGVVFVKAPPWLDRTGRWRRASRPQAALAPSLT